MYSKITIRYCIFLVLYINVTLHHTTDFHSLLPSCSSGYQTWLRIYTLDSPGIQISHLSKDKDIIDFNINKSLNILLFLEKNNVTYKKQFNSNILYNNSKIGELLQSVNCCEFPKNKFTV